MGDVIIAAALILITAPLMAMVCLAIKLESAGPAIYEVPRLGPGHTPYAELTFRTTMHEENPRFWRAGERETQVGHLLRYTRVEQLPQLFNLLWGDIKLLGSGD